MGFADLRPGEFCHSRSPWWSATFLRAHNALGAGMERASGLGWRQNLPKRGRRDPNHISMPAPEHGSALGSGQAVANSPNKTKQSCPFPAVLSLLSFLYCPFSANQTSPKIEGLAPDPTFPHPKAVLYFCMASRQLKTFGISLHHFQISISLVAVMNPPRNWNLKMNNQGGFFPTIIFFFPLEK